MKKTQALSVSIVIPVYNEEDHIEATLKSIAKQTVKPAEVIVVDNNSTDATVKIAKQFPFARIVTEKRQGRAYARNAGFNAAKSHVIGRLDADSVLDPDWVARVQHDFSDPDLMAVAGLGRAVLWRMPNRFAMRGTMWPRLIYWSVEAYFRARTLWGANMALRRSVWLKVRGDASFDDYHYHEDQDIALLIGGIGGKIMVDNRLLISTHKQSYAYLPKFIHYTRMTYWTKSRHKKIGTFAKPDMIRLSRLRTLPGAVIALLTSIPMFLTALICWPLDAVMVRRRAAVGKRWLD